MGHFPPGAGSCLVLLVTVKRRQVGSGHPLELAVAVGAVLAALDSSDRLAGVLPGGPLARLTRCPTYGFDELDELTHAYAVSIHRAQGSEYPVSSCR